MHFKRISIGLLCYRSDTTDVEYRWLLTLVQSDTKKQFDKTRSYKRNKID